jgi:PAS domain S-box-containing protein
MNSNSDTEIKNFSQRLTKIASSMQHTLNCKDISKFGKEFLKKIIQHMSAKGGCIYISVNDTLQLLYSNNIKNCKDVIQVSNYTKASEIINSNEPMLLDNENAKTVLLETTQTVTYTNNYLCFPLTADEQMLGIIVLQSKSKNNFTIHDIPLGKIIISFICKEISDKYTLEELEETQNQYKTLIDTLPIGIYRTTKQGKILFANNKLAEILEFESPEELLKQNVFDLFVDSKERQKQVKSWDENKISTTSFQLKTKKGNIIWVQDTGVFYTEKKNKQYFEGAIQDITQLKDTEEIYLLLYNVIEQMSESLVITDSNGEIEYVNPAFEKQTGYSYEEAIDAKPSILKSGQHDENFYKILWETITNGKTWKGELVNKKKDGNTFIENAVIFPIKNKKGEITHFAAVKRNITKEKMLEDQLQQSRKMESIGRLAGGIAHDFNNILTAIIGYAELLLATKNPGSTEWKQLNTILQSAQNAKKLTNQLLSFSRKEKVEAKPLRIDSTITKLSNMLHRLIEEDISLTFNLNAKGKTILAAEQQIQQILINLVVNAKDAMDGKLTKKIEVSTQAVQIVSQELDLQPGTYLLLKVSDTGKGIPHEMIHNIFEPFFTTKKKDKGTGLGLATVYGIVKQNNGAINVKSKPGEGTSFYIYWPLCDKDIGEENIQDNEEEIPQGPANILIVEDEETVRQVTEDMLSTLGYNVISFKNGFEALDYYIKNVNKISAVITDVTMPGMGGVELAQKIREINKNIKIIFSSGYSSKISELQNELYIKKPFSLSELTKIVNTALTN